MVRCRAILTLTDNQRQAIQELGAPLAVIDGATGNPYVLMEVALTPAEVDGVRATIPGISAIGEGDHPDEALLALCEALRAYLDGFADA